MDLATCQVIRVNILINAINFCRFNLLGLSILCIEFLGLLESSLADFLEGKFSRKVCLINSLDISLTVDKSQLRNKRCDVDFFFIHVAAILVFERLNAFVSSPSELMMRIQK